MPVIKRHQVKLSEAEILTKAARFFVGGFVKYLDSEASRRGWSNEFSVECLCPGESLSASVLDRTYLIW